MKFLFSETGTQVLQALSFTRTLYAFDFDGTLAPIVHSPEDAKMTAATVKLLDALASKAAVAVISGRSLKNLKECIGPGAYYLIGNHGLEGRPLRHSPPKSVQQICHQWKIQLEHNWRDLRHENGVFVEDKVYSLALHYRKSRNKKNARKLLYEKIEKLEPQPRVIGGKCIYNLIPQGAPHKGIALLELLEDLKMKCVFYVGDDDTDEDVFTLNDTRVISVRVGQKRSSSAQYYVRRQSQIQEILRRILSNLKLGESGSEKKKDRQASI